MLHVNVGSPNEASLFRANFIIQKITHLARLEELKGQVAGRCSHARFAVSGSDAAEQSLNKKKVKEKAIVGITVENKKW